MPVTGMAGEVGAIGSSLIWPNRAKSVGQVPPLWTRSTAPGRFERYDGDWIGRQEFVDLETGLTATK